MKSDFIKMNVKTYHFCKMGVISRGTSFESDLIVKESGGVDPYSSKSNILIWNIDTRAEIGHRTAKLPNWQMFKLLLSVPF